MALIDSKAKVTTETPGMTAEFVSEKTLEYLARRGWCLWECSALNDDIILIMDPEIAENVPAIYPAYTVQELREMAKNELPAMLLIHEAKKLCGAEVVNVG